MFNHSPKCKISWIESADSIEYITGSELLEGNELFTNYGQKGNEMLFGCYGFVLTDNQFDYYKIRININPKDSNYLFKKNEIDKVDNCFLWFESTDSIDARFLDLLDILALNFHEIQNIKTSRTIISGLSILYTLLLSDLNGLLDDCRIADESKNDESYFNSSVYRNGQIKIIRHVLNLVQVEFRNYIDFETLKKSCICVDGIPELNYEHSFVGVEDTVLAVILGKGKTFNGELDPEICEYYQEIQDLVGNDVTLQEFSSGVEILKVGEFDLNLDLIKGAFGIGLGGGLVHCVWVVNRYSSL